MVDRAKPQDVSKPVYFDFMANMGFTKHIGALDATDALVKLCHIGPESLVLDVGCGVGATPVYLVKELGCRVVGVDITPRMIERSKARARAAGVADKTEFRVADMHDLPFEDGTFDAVITESVVVFSKEPVRVIRELMRVAQPGGYVGITEATWTHPDVPEDVIAAMTSSAISNPDIKQPEEWEQVLWDAGLTEVVAEASATDIRREAGGRYKRYGCLSYLGALVRFFPLLIKHPEYRAIFKEALGAGIGSAVVHTGYGIYVGRKPVS